MFPRRRRALLILLGLALSLVVAGHRPVFSVLSTTGRQPAALQARGYGPRLYLLSPSSDQVARLKALPVTIHAELPGESSFRYVASGDAAAQVAIEAAGIGVRLLDPDTTGKVYYLVDAGAPHAQNLASREGVVLYRDPQRLLVAVLLENERMLVETLSTHHAHLSLLPAQAVSLAIDQPAGGAVALGGDPNPFIAGLLPEVTEQRLSDFIAELSGERPVTVGGQSVTIKSRYTFSGQIEYAEQYLYEYYTGLGLDVRYFDWTYGSYSGRNVIAEMPGTVHPERVWLIGGHFDSISSQSPYTLAPGADDNGSGTAATMLIAAILREYDFSDTIRFVHFSGEEQGQWGSRPYAQSLYSAGEQMLGYIDLDMIGYDGNGDRVIELHTGTGAASIALGDAFASANTRYGQGLTVEKKTTSASRFSDHSPFWDTYYPAFLAIENFFDDSISRDRNPEYHSTGDRIGLIDLDYLVRYTRTALATIAEQAGILPPFDVQSVVYLPALTLGPGVTPPPGECENILTNGDFESDAGWSFGETALKATYVTTPTVSGGRALQLGAPPAAGNATSYSSAAQEIDVPADAAQVFLRYWQRPGGGGGADNDFRQALLLHDKTLERANGPGSDEWEGKSFDLTEFRGQTVTLYFNVYNDGAGVQTWNYLDDVRVEVCGSP